MGRDQALPLLPSVIARSVRQAQATRSRRSELIPEASAPKDCPVVTARSPARTSSAEVCRVFGCKNATELRKSNEFNLAMAGRSFDLKTKADWQKLYREWVGVPQAERNRSGATCINGIDVLKNYRPWHVFGLEPSTATADDIKEAFRRLAKEHHPDLGGDPRVMERLQKMRDSLLAFR